MGKKDQIRSKIAELENDSTCDLDNILNQLGYDSPECIKDLLDCDIDSDDEEIIEIISKLTENNKKPKEDTTTSKLVSLGKKISKVFDKNWQLPDDVFKDLGNSISDYSSYGGTKTVTCSNKGLITNKNAASIYTTEDSESVEDKYKELISKIEEYASRLDQNKEYDYNTLCCLAKLYYKATQLNHDQCNQENAIDLADLMNNFYSMTTTIGLAGVIYGKHFAHHDGSK